MSIGNKTIKSTRIVRMDGNINAVQVDYGCSHPILNKNIVCFSKMITSGVIDGIRSNFGACKKLNKYNSSLRVDKKAIHKSLLPIYDGKKIKL